MRAAIKRGIRDRLVDSDPTEGAVVALGHRERPAYSSVQIMAILGAPSTDIDRALLGVLGSWGCVREKRAHCWWSTSRTASSR